MNNNGELLGVIHDFDGNMARTKKKNYNVTTAVVGKVFNISLEEVKARYSFLKSYKNYLVAIDSTSNWQDLYRQNTDMNEDQINEAGRLWTESQLEDHTKVNLFPGIEDLVKDLSFTNQAIVSQNSRENILLAINDLSEFFSGVVGGIIGYEEIGFGHQKPHQLPLILGIESFNHGLKKPGYVISVGDHPTDSHMVANFNRTTDSGIIVFHYTSTWANGKNNIDDWEFQPYDVLEHPSQVLHVVQNLPYLDYEMLNNGVIQRL